MKFLPYQIPVFILLPVVASQTFLVKPENTLQWEQMLFQEHKPHELNEALSHIDGIGRVIAHPYKIWVLLNREQLSKRHIKRQLKTMSL